MDGRRFDGWAKAMAGGASRRGVLRAGIGAGAAGAVAPLRGEEVGAAKCRRAERNCDRDDQCCSNRCEGGRCQCRKQGAPCTRDKDCCSEVCRPFRRVCR